MGHTFANLLVHVIFGTKERQPTIQDSFRRRLHAYMIGLGRGEFGDVVRVGGTTDHVHGLIALRTDVSVAEAMRKWKSVSSKWVKDTFAEGGGFAWQSGYAAFSVSPSNADEVKAYIENQVEHHRTRTFEEEFIAFLKRHNVPYDPEHVWD